MTNAFTDAFSVKLFIGVVPPTMPLRLIVPGPDKVKSPLSAAGVPLMVPESVNVSVDASVAMLFVVELASRVIGPAIAG